MIMSNKGRRRWTNSEKDKLFKYYCDNFSPIKGKIFKDCVSDQFAYELGMNRKSFLNMLAKHIYCLWSPQEDSVLKSCVPFKDGFVDYDSIFSKIHQTKKSIGIVNQRFNELGIEIPKKDKPSDIPKYGNRFKTKAEEINTKKDSFEGFAGDIRYIVTPEMEKAIDQIDTAFSMVYSEMDSIHNKCFTQIERNMTALNDGMSLLITDFNNGIKKIFEETNRYKKELLDFMESDIVGPITGMRGVLPEVKKMENHISSQKKFAEDYVIVNMCSNCGKGMVCSCSKDVISYTLEDGVVKILEKKKNSTNNLLKGCTKHLSKRTINTLSRNNIITVNDLTSKTEKYLWGLEGMGKNAIREINSLLSSLNLRLRK